MATVGDAIKAENARWSFGGDVCDIFDQHVRKSIPLYELGHSLICQLSDFFMYENTVCYELGCSTGELLIKLARRNADKPGARFIGIDIEGNMIQKAMQKSQDVTNAQFICDDILHYEYEKADMIVAYYTIQFIRPAKRQILFDTIYRSLNWGGAFLLFEKVRGPDARFQDIISAMYTDYKIEQGYSEQEIVHKAKSLKGVLEPFSTQGNLDLIRRAGFEDYMTIMKTMCFEGFFAIK
jgi:tRNA (cmo5U34)-methyltransferase